MPSVLTSMKIMKENRDTGHFNTLQNMASNDLIENENDINTLTESPGKDNFS
jgi:hypothetical protein